MLQEIFEKVTEEEKEESKEKFQEEDQKDLKLTAEEIIEKKREAIEKYYDAIVVMKDRNRVYKDIFISNRILKALKRSILDGRISAKDMLEIERQYRSLAENIWSNLSLISPEAPLLGVYQAKEWRKLNDPFSVKQKLIHRRNTVVIVPGSEVIGMLAIILKYFRIITNRFSTFPEQKSIEMIGQLKNLYEIFRKELKQLNERIIDEYNIILKKYKPPIVLGKNSKNNTEEREEEKEETPVKAEENKKEDKKIEEIKTVDKNYTQMSQI